MRPRRRANLLLSLALSPYISKTVRGLASPTSPDSSLLKSLSGLPDCDSGARARALLRSVLLDDPSRPPSAPPALYASLTIPRGASATALRDGDLAVQMGIRASEGGSTSGPLGLPSRLVELDGRRDGDRAALFLLCVFLLSSSTLAGLDGYLLPPGTPEIVRWLITWALSFSPLAYAGAGLAFPAAVQGSLIAIQRRMMPSYRRRMVVHEAGHFLLGHLLGWPVRGYAANAVRNAVEFYPLADDQVGKDRLALLGFDRASDGGRDAEPPAPADPEPFYSPAGRGGDALRDQSVFRDPAVATLPAVEPDDNPRAAWPYRGFDRAQIDVLAAVSMGGVCAELIEFGNAEGGYADVSQLTALMGAAEGGLEARERANVARFAMGYGVTQLRRHRGAFGALCEVMARDGSVAECVAAIENGGAGRSVEFPGKEEASGLEQMLLKVGGILAGGGDEAKENKRVEGVGGGDLEEGFVITGDDPVYIASAISIGFFVWASSGGLALH